MLAVLANHQVQCIAPYMNKVPGKGVNVAGSPGGRSLGDSKRDSIDLEHHFPPNMEMVIIDRICRARRKQKCFCHRRVQVRGIEGALASQVQASEAGG